jgi:hypothetical protein
MHSPLQIDVGIPNADRPHTVNVRTTSNDLPLRIGGSAKTADGAPLGYRLRGAKHA